MSVKLNDLKWPIIEDREVCGSDCWAEIATVTNEDGVMKVHLSMQADIGIPHDLMDGEFRQLPRKITALFMERILLDMARELVPELAAKIEAALKEVQLVAK